MTILIIGLVLFFSVLILATGHTAWRGSILELTVKRPWQSLYSVFVITGLALIPLDGFTQEGAREIVRLTIEQWRGTSSHGVFTMTIHRPDWERSMSMRSWTRGDKDSLVRVTEPPRDADNATLTIDNNMWIFSPRVNRVIKMPSSMLNQSWMGSDFSNNDITKGNEILNEYEHTLVGIDQQDGHEIYAIESIPNEDAAVVWGREVLRIRDDYILLEHLFYDQDDVLIKSLESLEIGERGGRTVATRQRMARVEMEDEWTEIYVEEMEFGVELRNGLFTLSNLRNPRE